MTNPKPTAEEAKKEFAEKYKTTWYPREGNIFDKYSNEKKLLSDLTALIDEHYYPKEFLLWTGENCQYYPETNEWMYFESPMTQKYFKGTDELYNYWKENER